MKEDWGAEHEYPREIRRTIIDLATLSMALAFTYFLFNSAVPSSLHAGFRPIRAFIVLVGVAGWICYLVILRDQFVLRRLASGRRLKRFHIEHDHVVNHIEDYLEKNRVAHKRWSAEGRLPLEPVPRRYKLLAEVFELELLGALIVVRRYGNLQRFDRYTAVFMGPVDHANRSYMEKLLEDL